MYGTAIVVVTKVDIFDVLAGKTFHTWLDTLMLCML